MANDIKVKLTPEGLREVTDAIRKVQKEAVDAAEKTQTAFGALKNVFETFKPLLPALGLTALTAGIVSLTKHTSEFFDTAGKASQRVGTTTEAFSALAFAAKTADVEQEQVEKSLAKLAKNVGDFKRGLGDGAEAFAQLGLEAKDFEGLDTGEVFAKIAQKLGKLPDGIDKTRLAIELLGRGGARLIPLMNDIAEKGFAAVAAEAEKFGAVVSGDTAKAAQVFNDNMTLLEVSSKKLGRQLVEGLLPSLNDISQAMIEAAHDGGILYAALVGVGGLIDLVFNGTELHKARKELTELQGVLELTKKSLASGKLESNSWFIPNIQLNDKALAKLRTNLEEQEKAVADAQAKIDKILHPKAKKRGEGEDTEGGVAFNAQSRLGELAKKLGDEQLKQLEEIAKRRQTLQQQAIDSDKQLLQAKLAASSNLLATQQQLDAAEQAALTARVGLAQEAYNTETQLAKAKAEALSALIKKSVIDDPKAAAALQTENTRQSLAAQIAAAQTYYGTLLTLRNQYAEQYKKATLAIKAIDDEQANNRLEREKFFTELSRQGLNDKQKYNAAIADADAKEAQLRDAVLAGDLEKARKYRDELIPLAKQIAQARGEGIDEARAQNLGKLFYERADYLLDLALSQKKIADTSTKVAAETNLAQLGTAIDKVQTKLDELVKLQSANINVKTTVDQESLRKTIDDIKDALGKEIFQIRVQPKVDNLTYQGGELPGRASGGPIPGPVTSGGDDTLMWGKAGEYMQSVPAHRFYGTAFMDAVNEMRLPRFAEGGAVGGDEYGMGGDTTHLNLTINGKKLGRVSGARATVRGLVSALNEVARGT